jgi:hypothetical protein
MTEGLSEPGDPSRIQLDAKAIVGSMLQEKPGLVNEALAAFERRPAGDLGKLLATGESATTGETGFDEPELIEPADEDIETIMGTLLKEHPEFTDVGEEVRRRIVVDAICTVLAEAGQT